MFYAIFEELCLLRGQSPSRVAEGAGLNRATVTFWKKEGFSPRHDTLTALSDYLAVPPAFLRGERVTPCPICGNGARVYPCRHLRAHEIARTYGAYWHDTLCARILQSARETVTDTTADEECRLRAVREAMKAYWFIGMRALSFPPDYIAPDAFYGRLLAVCPPNEWLTAEEMDHLRRAYPLTDTDAPCHLPSAWFDESPSAQHVIPVSLPVADNRIPVLGRIAAGNPLIAAENAEGWLPYASADAETYFALRVRGDSMVNAGIPDGALVILRRQTDVKDGQIAACMVDGEDATLKRVRRDGTHFVLCPENPAYAPRVVPMADFENGTARILGVAVEVRTFL